MANFARIIDNVAVDVSTEPALAFHQDIAAQFVEVPDEVQQGWLLVDGEWQAPPAPPEPEPVEPLTWANAPDEYWWIDVGPFYDRFGAKKLAVTSSQNPTVQGLLRLVDPRHYIDLKRADVAQMLAMLPSLVQGVTQSDVQAVLTTPTTEQERHIKGLVQPTA